MPLQPADTLELWTERELRRALLESLSMYLIPPQTAAGLFLMIGLHPAWGLRVAHETHKVLERTMTSPRGRTKGGSRIIEDETFFPRSLYEVTSRAVFSCVSVILETLRSLEEGASYSTEAFAQVVLEAARFARRQIERDGVMDRVKGGVDPFIDLGTGRIDESWRRALDFTTLDLLDNLLVPASVAYRFADQTFCVWPERIDQMTELFGLGRLGENHWLTDMVAEGATRVAS